MTGILVRQAIPADREAVLGLVPRLRDFGPSQFRPIASFDAAERRALELAFDAPPLGSVVFVAEDADHAPVGVAYVETATDYFTGEAHGHLAIIAVAEAVEGRGVGRALLAAVEDWAARRGYRFVSLNVFAANARARAIYERAGFVPDTMRYIKELGSS